MLHICIPTYNEGPTVGVLLWRIRKVFQDYSREYEVIVYDDASTDDTRAILEPYAKVLPLRILHGETRQGFGHALNVLAADVTRRTKYPRRDAMVVMQGDFTDQPESLPELVKRFEGGADIVTTDRDRSGMPVEVRRLARIGPWMMRSHAKTEITDPFGSYRLFRISLMRDYSKNAGAEPLITSDGWAANLEMLVKLSSFARKIESVTVAPRYDLRPRATRVRPFADAMGLFRAGKAARSWRTVKAARA